MDLLQYLKKESAGQHTEFRLVVLANGQAYIHVMNRDSETLNFNIDTIPSDEDLKTDIEPVVDSSSLLDLKPVTYKMKGGSKKQFGFIAQQIEDTPLSNIVFKNSQGVRSVAYNQVIPLLVHQNQELIKRLANLEGFVSKYTPIG